MVINDDSYKDHAIPDGQSMNPSEKDGKYYLGMMQGFYSAYTGGRTGISFADTERIVRNRAYGRGAHDTTRFVTYLTGKKSYPDGDASNLSNSKDSKLVELAGKAWEQVNFTPISPIPKIKAINSRLSDIDYDVVADAVDPLSRDREMDRKAYAMFFADHQDFIKEYSEAAGIPVDEPEFVPESPEEMEVFAQEDGFKALHAMHQEMLMKYSFEQGDWQEIRRQHNDDVQDTGFIGLYVTKDPNSGRMYPEYVDVGSAFVQYSEHNDFRDSEYAGHFRPVTISQMISWGASQKQVLGAVKYYNGRYGNSKLDDIDSFTQLTSSHRNMKVCAMNAAWIDCDIERHKHYVDRLGQKRVKAQVGADWDKTHNGNNGRTVDTRKRLVREAVWVVGTDFMPSFGVMVNMPWKDDREVMLPYCFYRLPYTPMVEICIPFVDGLNLAWFKLQNAMLVASNSGHAVNVSMLQNLKTGTNERLSWVDAIKVFRGIGVLPFMQSFSGRYEGGAVNPMVKIQGGIGEAMQECITMMDVNMNNIHTFTGMNPLQLAEQTDPRTPTRTSQMLMDASNDVVKPYVRAAFKVKEDAARVLSARVYSCSHDSGYMRRAYGGILSDAAIKVLGMAKREGARYGVSLRVRPTDDEKMGMREAANIALQAQLIDPAVHNYILEQVAAGSNFKRLRMFLTYKMEKERERKHLEQQALIREQSEGNMRLEQAKQQTLQMESELRLHSDTTAEERKQAQVRETNRQSEVEKRVTKIIEEMAKADANREELIKMVKDERKDWPEDIVQAAQTPAGEGGPDGQPPAGEDAGAGALGAL